MILLVAAFAALGLLGLLMACPCPMIASKLLCLGAYRESMTLTISSLKDWSMLCTLPKSSLSRSKSVPMSPLDNLGDRGVPDWPDPAPRRCAATEAPPGRVGLADLVFGVLGSCAMVGGAGETGRS